MLDIGAGCGSFVMRPFLANLTKSGSGNILAEFSDSTKMGKFRVSYRQFDRLLTVTNETSFCSDI